MNLIDFVYYIAHKAVMRIDERDDSFFKNSLWFSLLQFMLLIIIFFGIELLIQKKFFSFLEKPIYFAAILILIAVINNIYLGFGNKIDKIKKTEYFSVSAQKFYWILLCAVFFAAFIFAGILAIIRIKTFG